MLGRVVTRSSSRLLPLSRHVVGIHPQLFSTVSPKLEEKEETVTLPPNLTIDARSTCSPVFGLERVRASSSALQEEEEELDNDEEDDYEAEADGYETDEEITQEEIYNLASRPEPLRAIPLPDRLYVNVLDKYEGDKVGTLYLNEKLFGHDDIRVDLLARTVQYQRNQKRGKRKAITKTIGQVSGSTRKVRQQKGTGQARAGHARPAHWRGGAKAHGPKGSIQDYANCKLNKHTRKLALTHALSQKLKEGNLIVVNDLNIESHKTKELASLLKKWDIASRHGTTAYLIDHVVVDNEEHQDSWKGLSVNLVVAAKNLYKIKVSNQLMANVYDILKHEKLLLTVEAVTALEARLDGLLRY